MERDPVRPVRVRVRICGQSLDLMDAEGNFAGLLCGHLASLHSGETEEETSAGAWGGSWHAFNIS
jgi:hypothetical protein